jgi:hypothetical protein
MIDRLEGATYAELLGRFGMGELRYDFHFRTRGKDSQLAITAAEARQNLLAQGFHDSGNAERLILRHGHEPRYCHAFKKWLIYDRRRWAIDKTDQSRKLAKQTIVAFMEQAIEARK